MILLFLLASPHCGLCCAHFEAAHFHFQSHPVAHLGLAQFGREFQWGGRGQEKDNPKFSVPQWKDRKGAATALPPHISSASSTFPNPPKRKLFLQLGSLERQGGGAWAERQGEGEVSAKGASHSLTHSLTQSCRWSPGCAHPLPAELVSQALERPLPRQASRQAGRGSHSSRAAPL